MSRRFDTRRVRSGGRLVGTALDRVIQRMGPAHWFRADTYTLSAGNLATLPNLAASGGVLTVTAGALAAPAADATLGNRETVTFSGTQQLDSSLPAADFRFLSNGAGCDTFSVHVGLAAGATQTIWSTRLGTSAAAEIGACLQFSGGGHRGVLVNATAAAPLALASATFTDGTATYSEFTHATASTPDGTLTTKTTAVTANYASAPSAIGPDGTFRLGAMRNNTQRMVARWAETLLFSRVLTAAERQTVRDYILVRYGFT